MQARGILTIASAAIAAGFSMLLLDGGVADDVFLIVTLFLIVAAAGFTVAAAVDRWVDRPVHNPHLPPAVRSHSARRAPRCSTCRTPMESAGSLLLCTVCDRP